MKLSVVIAVYNAVDTLQRCVDSIVAQQESQLEVILADDESTDGSLQMCHKIAAAHPFITVLESSHVGLSQIRNKAVSMSTGQYVTFVDSDDEIAPDTYSPLLELLEHNPELDIVEYPIHKGYPKKGLNTWKPFNDKQFTSAKHYWLQTQAYRHCFACNKIFRRQLLTDNPFHTVKAFEDVELMTRLLPLNPTIATTSHGMYRYYDTPTSITHEADSQALQTLFDLQRPVYEQLPNADYQLSLINMAIDIFRLTGRRNPIGRKPYFNSIKQIICNQLGINVLYNIIKFIRN